MDIPEDTLREWIKIHKNVFIFSHLETTYVYRQLSRREYRALLNIEDELNRTEEVCSVCILNPANIDWADYKLAGVPEVLCNQIMNSSGCSDMKENYDNHLANIATNLEDQMESVIDYVFNGGGDFAKYQDWSHDQLYQAYARAAWVYEAATQVKIQAVENTNTQPQKRGYDDREKIKARREELQKLHDIKNANPSGENEMTGLGIPKEFSTDRGALSPMSEAQAKYDKVQLMKKRKEAMASVKSVPVL